MAADYLRCCCVADLATRSKSARRRTFEHRIEALGLLYCHVTEPDAGDAQRAARVAQWERNYTRTLVAPPWSHEQSLALHAIASALGAADANAVRLSERFLYLRGEPGSGKTDVILHAALDAAAQGLRVLILCPTGALMNHHHYQHHRHPHRHRRRHDGPAGLPSSSLLLAAR